MKGWKLKISLKWKGKKNYNWTIMGIPMNERYFLEWDVGSCDSFDALVCFF